MADAAKKYGLEINKQSDTMAVAQFIIIIGKGIIDPNVRYLNTYSHVEALNFIDTGSQK